MRYVKLYEQYTNEDYQKALMKVKDMLSKDFSKDKIISFISNYTSDDAFYLDSIRKIVDGFSRKYNLYRRCVSFKKNYGGVKLRVIKHGDKTVSYVYDFFLIDQNDRKSLMSDYLPKKKEIERLLSCISDGDKPTKLKIQFRRLFFILDWVFSDRYKMTDIYSNSNVYLHRYLSEGENMDDALYMSMTDMVNDMDNSNALDVDNPYLSYEKSLRLIKKLLIEIKTTK